MHSSHSEQTFNMLKFNFIFFRHNIECTAYCLNLHFLKNFMLFFPPPHFGHLPFNVFFSILHRWLRGHKQSCYHYFYFVHWVMWFDFFYCFIFFLDYYFPNISSLIALQFHLFVQKYGESLWMLIMKLKKTFSIEV